MEISNYSDTLSSSDIIGRIEYLSSFDTDALHEDEITELANLKKVATQGESFEDWNYGLTLIHSTYFDAYAKDMVIECNESEFNAMPKLFRDNLDWEGIIDDVRRDYSEIDFDGMTYYTR